MADTYDPVYEGNDGWYFADETQAHSYGPFLTRQIAMDECDAYAKTLTPLLSVAVAEVVSSHELGPDGFTSTVRWLFNPLPIGAHIYEPVFAVVNKEAIILSRIRAAMRRIAAPTGNALFDAGTWDACTKILLIIEEKEKQS